jgi:hypothetical protein
MQDTPMQSLKGAVLVVGRDFVTDDTYAATCSRLCAARDTVSVVLDSWLDACGKSKARVPLSNHLVAPTWLTPAPPGSLGCAAAGLLGPGPPTPLLQQHHPVAVVASLAIAGPRKRSLVVTGGQSALLQGAIDAALAAAAAAASGGCDSARARRQAGAGAVQLGSSTVPAAPSVPAALQPFKRQRTSGHGSGRSSSSSGGSGGSGEPAAGAGQLDLAAAGDAALAAVRQLSAATKLSSSTVDALREIVGSRAWVPANAPPPAAPAAGAAMGPVGSADTSTSSLAQPVSLSGADSIRVVSYNMLADACTLFGKRYCRQQFRAWSSRWPRLARELAAYAPDILCLQVCGGLS